MRFPYIDLDREEGALRFGFDGKGNRINADMFGISFKGR